MGDKDTLQERLQALRGNNRPASENTPTDPATAPDEDASDQAAERSHSNHLDVPVWHDGEKSTPPAPYLSSTKSYYNKSMHRLRSMHHIGEVSEKPSYEDAFKVVQLAVEAERSGDPLLAVNLYTDAGEILIQVGKEEADPTLQHGMKEKSYELLTRAEKIQSWCEAVQASHDQVGDMPEQSIQFTDVPTVEKSWQAHVPPRHDQDEFKKMRYTAVETRDPIKFTSDGYELRCQQMHRDIDVLITVTMYNEDGSELKATLTGIVKNIQYMQEHFKSNHYWERVAVVIVSDGRLKASSSCLDYLSSLGAFDEEIMAVTSLGVDVQMHLFESSPQFIQDENFESYYPPIQIIYALKEHNGGKLDSHLWFFNAFAEQLQPKYTVLLDVGTIPGDDSIFRLIRSMNRNPQIGGVAGEIAVYKPNFLSPVIASQHFEYKISNIMDKSLESVLGFISVLPGAFSAYRYEAIRAKDGQGPLPEYFKSLTTSTKDLGPFKGNMYLAEDRILCFELLARNNCHWTMHYVKDAIACTDVPEDLVSLIKQRRRWLNGSFFAGIFAILNFHRVWRNSSHSFIRKLFLTLQFIYLTIQSSLSWFLLSNLFLTFYYVLLLALYDKSEVLFQGIIGTYLAFVAGLIIFALGNRPEKRTAVLYSTSSMFFALVMLAVTGLSVYGLVADLDIADPRPDLPTCPTSDLELQLGVIASLGLIFASAILHGEFGIFLSTIAYFAMLPTYVNILGIYAYSNLHDLSWGTKGLEAGSGHGTSGQASDHGKGNIKDVVAFKKKQEAAKQKAKAEKEDVDNSFRAFRSGLLLIWLMSNAIWMFAATSYLSSSCYLSYLSYVVAAFNVIRFLGSLVFVIFRLVRRVFGSREPSSSANVGSSGSDLPSEWRSHYQKTTADAQDQLAAESQVDVRVVTTPGAATAYAKTE